MDKVWEAVGSGRFGDILQIDFWKALRFTLTFTFLTLPLVLGVGLALALAVAGADVALTYRSLAPDDIRGKIADMGRRSAAVQADFTDMDASAATQVVDFARDALGGLDILVNNAGIIHREDSTHMPLDDWRRGLSVNLDSVWLLSQAAGRHMVAQGAGRIITVASVLSHQGGLRVAGYADRAPTSTNPMAVRNDRVEIVLLRSGV